MSNIVPFPLVPQALVRPFEHVGARILLDPPAHTHALQFYDSEAFLFETAAQFVAAGLCDEGPAIVVATPAHTEGILAELEPALRESALRSGLLQVFDADAVLSQFMVGDMPDGRLLAEAIERVFAGVPQREAPSNDVRDRPLRVYGEMVDILWRGGNAKAALELENAWNRATDKRHFVLLCGYGMSTFYKQDESPEFHELCRLHTHVLPTEYFAREQGHFEQLRKISKLEQRARLLEYEVQYRRELESALRDAFEARLEAERELSGALIREREARLAEQANTAFKGLLGHLVQPLNRMLTSSRLLADSSRDNTTSHRLRQLVANGARVQSMIEQLLLVARHPLEEVRVELDEAQDVVPLVSKVVEQARAASGVPLELCAASPHPVCFDAQRLELALLQLLEHSIAQADQQQAIVVNVAADADTVCLRIQRQGPALSAQEISRLFEPLREVTQRLTSLYFAHGVIKAHEGTLDIESSEQAGTTLVVSLPRRS